MTFTVYGVAKPKGSARAFMPKGARFPVVTSDNPGAKGWEQSVKYAAQQVAGELLLGPVFVGLTFVLPRPKSRKRDRFHLTKPDLDKCVRAVVDGLTGIVFKDDSQVVEIAARKHYQASESQAPHCVVHVHRRDDSLL